MKYLFLAEKPSAMKIIQEAYNKSNKPLGDIDFFALSGHICKLCEPKDYEQWNVNWRDRELPMIPKEFKVGPLRQDVIDKLISKLNNNSYDAIIVGTDSDVEGNGIYDLIESYLGLQNYKTYRFFESDLTPAGIMRSMNNLQDYHTHPRDVGMTEAYRIRSRFDWLIGFNMSVAYTVKSGFLMKVGRVKAPTLKLIYDNCKAIDNFTSSTAYQPTVETEANGLIAGLVDDTGKTIVFPKEEDAEAVLKELSGKAIVKKITQETKATPPHQLYKLTDIQYEAGVKYGYTPEKTLELIQSLYETHKLISYPRTDGRYVSSEKAKDFQRLLKAVERMPELKDIAKHVSVDDIASVQNNSRYVNDKKVQESSHDALMPTGETSALGKLSKDEKNICEMIFRRFLAIFLPAVEEEKTKITLEDNNYLFSCNGSKIIHPGWSILFSKPTENVLPQLSEGELLKEKRKFLHKVVSNPPQRFTQATLIKAMENIQKYIKEDDLKDAAKKAGGIGQPSSRAAIIAELVLSGYVEDVATAKKGRQKGLYMTEEGKKYIENLGNSSIVNPKLSAEWEVNMNNIREGTNNYEDVYQEIIDYLNTALTELEHMNIKKFTKERKTVGTCPICGKPVVELPKGYGCSGYPDCKVIIPKVIAGKKLSERNIRDLLEKGATEQISGFKSKAGKDFSSALILKDGKVEWEPFEQTTELTCPKCGKALLKTPMTYKCSDNDCGYTLWRNICGKMLTEGQVKDLITGKKTELIQGFKSKTGKVFNARLVIKDDKLQFEFDSTAKTMEVKCPICGSHMVDKERIYVCSKENDSQCNFCVSKEIAKKTVMPSMLKEILENGKTKSTYKFKGKNGEFEAYLVFDAANKKIIFESPDKKK